MMNSLRGERLRNTFVVAEVALALVLLICATLLGQSLYRLSHVPPGFDPNHVLTGTVSVSGNISNERLGTMCRAIVSKLRQLPEVESASFITFLPFTGLGAATSYSVAGRPPYADGQKPVADVRVVQPGYFETMRIPLTQGRLFTDSDDQPGAPRHFLVNQKLARETFGNTSPLGQSLIVNMGDDFPGEIVGVVGDTRHLALDGDIRPMVYYPQAHLPISFGSFVVRTKVPPEMMSSALARVVREVKGDQPVSDVRTVDNWIGRSMSRTKFETALLIAFALIAITLAIVGVYGVMAYSVEQRTQEIGVRIALGADPGAVKRFIAARGMRLAAVGLSIGLFGAAASTRLLSSLLFSVRAGDPLTFLATAVLVAVACLLASYIPARRAVAIDPMEALRSE